MFNLMAEDIKQEKKVDNRIRCTECREKFSPGKIHHYDNKYFIYCPYCGDKKTISGNQSFREF